MRLTYILALMLLPLLAFSQEEAFYIEFNNANLREALIKIENTYGVMFSFSDNYIEGKSITMPPKKRRITDLIIELESNTNLSFQILAERYIIVTDTNQSEPYFESLDRVIIRSYLARGIKKKSDGTYNLYPKQLGILPGLTEPDVLESIQLLPGVLSPNETATGFFVRAGSSDQNRLIWDGINLYHKGHLFGMISPLNPNITSKITFANKGTNARYGERVSSVIDMSSKTSITNKLNGSVGFNGVNIDGVVEVPLVSCKLGLQASVRRSYADFYETITFEQLANKTFESTKINQDENGNNDFSFLDYTLKINYRPSSNHYVYASFISIDNSLDYLSAQSDNNTSFNDIMSITNSGYSVGWNYSINSKTSLTTSAFFSDYKLNYNFITNEEGNTLSKFEKRNTIFDSGISAELNYLTSHKMTLDFGLQYTLKDVAYAFLNTTDLTFVLDSEDDIVQSFSGYGTLSYRDPESINVSFGLRNTYYKELNAFRLEPRLMIFKEINKHIKLQASAEIKNQIISEIDETVFSDLSLENRVWRLSNNDKFPILNSMHFSTGFIFTENGYTLDLDFYYKKLKNITALSLGYLNPENGSFNVGDQSIYGIDAYVRKRFGNINTWISYTFNRSRSNFANINNGKSFISRSNVTHAFTSSVSYNCDGFQLALGWWWQTGRPFTIAREGVEGLQFNRGVNTGQLPHYHRLDLSTTYSFKLSKKPNSPNLKAGLSIRNIYNRKNLIGIEYRGNNSLNDGIEQLERYSIGITPNLMFRIEW